MSDFSSEATPLELFRQELEERVEHLNQVLLQLEAEPGSQDACDQVRPASWCSSRWCGWPIVWRMSSLP
jgi:chemotaxis protein histidine kinase CheA